MTVKEVSEQWDTLTKAQQGIALAINGPVAQVARDSGLTREQYVAVLRYLADSLEAVASDPEGADRELKASLEALVNHAKNQSEQEEATLNPIQRN